METNKDTHAQAVGSTAQGSTSGDDVSVSVVITPGEKDDPPADSNSATKTQSTTTTRTDTIMDADADKAERAAPEALIQLGEQPVSGRQLRPKRQLQSSAQKAASLEGLGSDSCSDSDSFSDTQATGHGHGHGHGHSDSDYASGHETRAGKMDETQAGTSAGNSGMMMMMGQGVMLLHGRADREERRPKAETPKRSKRGPQYWTLEEDEALCRAVREVGREGWHAVAAHARLVLGDRRTAEQCCHRWHRVLNPRINRAEWTPEEDARLAELVNSHGASHWKRLAQYLPGRTDQQCRYRWHQISSTPPPPPLPLPLPPSSQSQPQNPVSALGSVAINTSQISPVQQSQMQSMAISFGPTATQSDLPSKPPSQSQPQSQPQSRPKMMQRASHARRDFRDRTVATKGGFVIDVWHLRPQANALAIEVAASQSPIQMPSIEDYVDMPTRVGRSRPLVPTPPPAPIQAVPLAKSQARVALPMTQAPPLHGIEHKDLALVSPGMNTGIGELPAQSIHESVMAEDHAHKSLHDGADNGPLENPPSPAETVAEQPCKESDGNDGQDGKSSDAQQGKDKSGEIEQGKQKTDAV